MDLIRCGEQFSSYAAALRPPPPLDGYLDDEYDDAECPGANTAHLAQEYLLEVLAIKFREQLESAYQAALQHSLAVQAELLREEIAELQRDQQPSQVTNSKNKKKKEKKKKKKKVVDAKTTHRGTSGSPNNQTSSNSTAMTTDNQLDGTSERLSPSKTASSNRRGRSTSAPTSATKKARSNQADGSRGNNQDDENEPEEGSEQEDEDVDPVDREVEEFRLLLEKINAQQKPPKAKPKLVLPPGAFGVLM